MYKNKIIPKRQYDFMRKRGKKDALYFISEIIFKH